MRQGKREGGVTRRDTLKMLGVLAAAPGGALAAGQPIRREIPTSGELLPALGLGTWQVLDVPASGPDYERARDALASFLNSGGSVIDTSPMYGRSEERIGDMLAEIQPATKPFLATKIWTRGAESGRRQLADSHRLMRAETIDLVQVHNLLDLGVQMPTIRAAKEAGTVRYTGVTHHVEGAHDEVERVIRRERPDFVQINYSLAEPESGERLLPAARDLGVAVLVNKPFVKGSMIDRAAGKPLPPVAEELGCRSAAQLFLKWVLGNPAVTVILAATRNPKHAAENVEAATGAVPDAAQRRAIERWFAAL